MLSKKKSPASSKLKLLLSENRLLQLFLSVEIGSDFEPTPPTPKAVRGQA